MDPLLKMAAQDSTAFSLTIPGQRRDGITLFLHLQNTPFWSQIDAKTRKHGRQSYKGRRGNERK